MSTDPDRSSGHQSGNEAGGADEAVLRRSEERHRSIIQNSFDIIVIVGIDGKVSYESPSAARILGYAPGYLIGRSPLSVVHPDDMDFVSSRLLEVVTEKRQGMPTPFRCRRVDGSWINLEALGSNQFNNPNVRGVIITARDISERKRSEDEREKLLAQLIQAQKMEAVGQLAGGVAHDFNNILAAILMYLDVLRSEQQLNAEMQMVLSELEDAANRAASLTRQLLVFSRRQITQKQLLEVDALLGNLTKMLRRLIGEQIGLEFKNAAQPLWVEADGGMLEQVVMNLVVNARDAMPKGGRITLMTRRVQVGETDQGRNPEARPGQFVCLTVSDTGCGMDDNTRRHLFEPFFTTKDVGKGTGLGLATVYGIVKKHDGWIEVESTPGQGSAFHVYLPASQGGPAATLRHEPRQAVPGGRESLLLVEDDTVLREQAASVLQNAGYRVCEAANGQEALTVWTREAGQFDLLLTDMIMPEGLTGLELARLLRKEKPGLKVVLISGYNIEFTQEGLPTKHHISYLPKPFKASALAWTVRRCLDAK